MKVVYVILAVILAVLGAHIYGWATRPEPSIAESKRQFNAVVESIYIPPRPVELRGDIRLVQKGFKTEPEDLSDRDERGNARRFRVVCDARCAALLDTPGVSSVTVVPEELAAKISTKKIESNVARTFRLLPKSGCREPTVRPDQPSALDIESVYPVISKSKGSEQARAAIQSSIASWQSVEAAWDLRLSTTHCIIAEAPVAKFDFAINLFTGKFPDIVWKDFDKRWSTEAAPVSYRGLEVIDAKGRTRLRTLAATTSVLRKPRWVRLYHRGGYNLDFGWGWRRSRLSNRGEYDEFNADKELQRRTNLKVAIDQADLMDQVQIRLRQALDDKKLDESDPAFDLAEPWMRSLAPGPVPKIDQAMLADLIRDARVTDFQGIWEVKKSLGSDIGILADPIIYRLARGPINEETMKPLAAQLPDIPDLFKAKSTTEISLILSDPDRRKYAPGLIVAQAQRGSAAVPFLLDIIKKHGAMISARSGNDNILPIDAAQQALCRIGPAAASALPQLESMARSGILPVQLQEDRNWQFMLARIGKPVSTIKKPRNMSGTDDQFHKNLDHRLKRFDFERDCEGNWT